MPYKILTKKEICPNQYEITIEAPFVVRNAKAGTCRKALCIGEKTAEAAREQGFDVIVSDEATIESMLKKATEIFA